MRNQRFKEDVVYMYIMEYYSVIKKNEKLPFVATQMDLEVIILSKSERERQVPYGITYRWNLKYDAQELIYETERDSQTQRTDSWLPRGGGWRWEGLRVWDQQM